MSELRTPEGGGPGAPVPAPRTPVTGRLVFGLVVILLGVLFLLEEFGISDASTVLRWWPAALLAYGVMRLTGTGCRQQTAAGVVFTLIGGWMLLRELGVISYRFRDFWPLVLIAVGVTLVSGGLRRRRAVTGPADPSSIVSAFAFWSGVDRKVVTPDFQGGDLTAIMGGHEIDLRSAKIAGGGARRSTCS